MPDLFDPLRDLDQQLPTSPLPASEVRRRGDRIRRRRQALQLLGGAAAVAVVVAGSALVLADPDVAPGPDPVPVAPAPEGGWLQEIPDDHPLDRGLPPVGSSEETRIEPSAAYAPFSEEPVEACGEVGYPSTTPADSLGTRWAAPEDYHDRELTVYADSAAASAVMSSLVDTWRGCPTQELPDPPFAVVTQVTRGSSGDESWTAVKGAQQFPSLTVFEVVRVGNAVLITRLSNEATLEAAQGYVDEQAAQLRPLVADLCIFALDPCSKPGAER